LWLVRRDYCWVRFAIVMDAREAQIRNWSVKGRVLPDRVTDLYRQRLPAACRHRVVSSDPPLAGTPQASRPHIARLGEEGKPLCVVAYFLSSLPPDRLSPQQWLTVIRRHWSVETTHQILDGAFQEDDRPWVSHSPRLTTVIMILRRIGYTLLAIFKHVTQRSDARRDEPWHVLLSRVRDAMLLATDAIVAGLRRRSAEPLPTPL
jgi:hypothetical protein